MDGAERRFIVATMTTACALEDVAEAIGRRVRPGRVVYVERRTNGYRWSPSHAGGPYPLLRELALVVDRHYTTLVVPFETIDGRAVIRAMDGSDDVLVRGFG